MPETKAPDEMKAKAPDPVSLPDNVTSDTKAPELARNVPPELTVTSLTKPPLTSNSPPAATVVEMALPPKDTTSSDGTGTPRAVLIVLKPDIVVLDVAPPLETKRAPPLVTKV